MNASAETCYGLTASDFELAFGDALPPEIIQKLALKHLQYRLLHDEKRDACLQKIVDTLLSLDTPRSGAHRRGDWEAGWGENLRLFDGRPSQSSVIPKYFGKYRVVRWRQQLIEALHPSLEYEMLNVLRCWLFGKYCRSADTIYEFGCGTGHNLLAVREYNPSAHLIGLDWATTSQELLRKMKLDGSELNITGQLFDFFNPDYGVKIKPNSVVFTIAALEQVGDQFHAFLDYLLANRPALCFHIEPISELLNPENFLDYLSMQYSRKRNYLSGFLHRLREYETEGRVRINLAQRSFIGSFFIDGYSVIAWEPS